MKTNLFVAIVAGLLLVLAGYSHSVNGQTSLPVTGQTLSEKISWLENGQVRLGADLERGGAIGYLADSTRQQNIVNTHDLGRWVGQSYYAGPKPFGSPHPGWKNWDWNPVNAGDVYGNPSRVVEHRNDGKTLYLKTQPMQWALQNVPAECLFETWIRLENRVIHVRNRLTNRRQDKTQYRAQHQELPFVYTHARLNRLVSYTEDAPFTNAAWQQIPANSQQNLEGAANRWSTLFANEHWAALVDENDYGLGLIHPGVVRFLGGCYRPKLSGKADDARGTDETGYLAAIRDEILDHNIVFEYQYSLVLGTIDEIRREAYRQKPANPCPSSVFDQDRQHWWLNNATDSGIPITGKLRIQLDQKDPQMIGPEGFWDAAIATKLSIRAAYRTKDSTGEIFWQRTDQNGFPADQRLTFPILPDGKMRTYEIDLSASSLYRGKLRRLRFDPVVTGNPGDEVDVESITSH